MLLAEVDFYIPVLELHGAVSLKVEMHLEGTIPHLWLVTDLAAETVSFSNIEILSQLIPVFRVSTLLDDAAGAILRRKTAEVGKALLGDDAVQIMLGMVNMRAVRYYAGDAGWIGLGRT